MYPQVEAILRTEHGNIPDGRECPEFELASMEKRHIAWVLQFIRGNRTEVSRLLKIGLTTLYRKIEEYGIPS